ncbi:MAG: hypothetical protein UW08_C0013G0001, partial [Parcubacteria group bacterium GW2011_GWB1_43_8b]
PNEVLTTGQTDEFCLSYESTGTTWEWKDCSGGTSYWSKSVEGILYPTLSEPIAATSSATTVATFTSTGSNLGLQLTADSVSSTTGADFSFDGLTTGTGLLVSSSGIIASGGELVQLTANSATTGDILAISATGLTSGRGQFINVASTDTAATNGIKGQNIVLSDTGNVSTGNDYTYGQYVDVTRTGASGGTVRGYGQYISAVGDLSTDELFGTYIFARNGLDNFGVYSQVENTSSTNVEWASAIDGDAGNTSSGDLAYAFGGNFRVYNSGSGTLSEGYGINIAGASNTGGGSFLNNYGIYIEDQSGVGSVESYNLYSVGTNAKNYFAGLVGIGTDTTPEGFLDVEGAKTGQALVQLNETGDQDILVASRSGDTRFRLADSGQSGGLLFIDPSGSAPTCSSAAQQGQIYTTTTDIYYCDGSGWVDLTVQGGGGALDTLTVATTNDTALDNDAWSIGWNWDFQGAGIDTGLTISESANSTSGGQDEQALLELITLTNSTASPLQVTAGGLDVGDIWFDLTGAADFQIRDSNAVVFQVDQDGLTTISDDVDVSLGTGENLNIVEANAPSVDMVVIDNTGNATATDTVDGLSVTLVQGESSGTNAALHATITGSGTAGEIAAGLQVTSAGVAGGTLYGVTIDTITGGASTAETAVNIGNGWDNGLYVGTGITADINLADSSAVIEMAGAATVTIGDTATSGDTLVLDLSNNSLTLGLTASNGVAFDVDANTQIYYGTARPRKTLTVSPEYPGAVLSATYVAGTDTNTTGTMTSDTATGSATLRNYYQWVRTQSTLHYNTVALKVALPKDFSAWDTTGNAIDVDFVTNSNSAANNVLDVYIYREDDASSAVGFQTGKVSGTGGTWTTVSWTAAQIDDGAGIDWDTANQMATIYLRMGSLSSNWVRIGDIDLNYLGKF